MKKAAGQNPKFKEVEAPQQSQFCDITAVIKSPCCTILERISDGVFTIDRYKRITSFNRAAEAITGFKNAEAVGRHCFDVFRANICEKRCALDQTIDSGNPQVNQPAVIISKDGKQKTISISTAILKNPDGEIIGGVETFRDLSDLEELRRQINRTFTREDIIGQHPRMRDILSFLPDIAESESPVLVQGPTGSGKELIARAIHNLSSRKDGPFVAVNCAAIPETLLESELFGYKKGAFTGAVRDKAGRFSLANRGTLFLDEVSNTSKAFQADLLRVLEEGEFTPLGGTHSAATDFRVVAASNKDLKEMIAEDAFREDLYYRLAVAKINLPPLRERREDIPFLIDHFIRKYNLLKKRTIQGVTSEVLSLLVDYSFPGNIRELENIIEYAFIACKEAMIGIEHLSDELPKEQKDRSRIDLKQKDDEAEIIRAALEKHAYIRDEVARYLGMSRTTLWRKMKQHGIVKH